MMIWAISSHESSCLANCRPLHQVSIIAYFLYSQSKKLVFVPVVSALIGAHRHCLVQASITQQPELQPIVSRGQIVSTDLP